MEGKASAPNASLRRHYPHQVPRVFLTRPAVGQDPCVEVSKLLQSVADRNVERGAGGGHCQPRQVPERWSTQKPAPAWMPTVRDSHLAGHTLHVIQRGYRRAACFSDDQDRQVYLHWLTRYAEHTGCAVHAYVLMGNHVHMLLTPSRADGVSCLLRLAGERYARYFGEVHEHAATLWEDRAETRPVYPRQYLLGCMRYIESNPVRAGLVARPDQYRWSSFRSNALGCADALVTPHAFYCALGRTQASRQAAYRALFSDGDAVRALQSRARGA